MNMKNFFIVYSVFLINLLGKSDGLNILAITPHNGKSHQLVFEGLFKKLATIGHSVTHITRFPVEIDSPNWRTVNVANQEQNSTELFTFDLLTGTRLDRYTISAVLLEMADVVCSGLSHPNLQKFLSEEQHFDVVLIEMFNTNCFMGIANKYNAPVIGLHSSSWMPWMYEWFGLPFNPAYWPEHFLGFTDTMNFFERLENFLLHKYHELLFTYAMARNGNELSKTHVGIDLYEHGDVMKTVDLLLINTHYTLNLPFPLVPNVIEIGGIHIDAQPPKKLPQDIERFIRESKQGVIYMSMGSTIRGDSLPEAKKQALLKAFSKLPQRVIWKWEGEMKYKPDNVLTVRWAPQRDIICHPNVKVFITHAGLSGIIEGVHCAKPLLMLPQFGDQFTNAAAVEKNRGGLAFTLGEINEKVALEALRKLLSRQFVESAQTLSRRFKDRPLSPTDTALYWIDYVVKHKGAPFMKTAALNMPAYKYYLLDLISFLLAISLILLYGFYLLIKSVKKKYGDRKNKEKLS